MKHKVTRKQYTSHNCFVCGESNVCGLGMRFYETDSREVVGVFTGRAEHCSYPGRMHGGIVSAVIDETIGRAAELEQPGIFGVTTSLEIKFRKPVPLGVELMCVGKVIELNARSLKGMARILLPDGKVAAEGHATYCVLSIDGITGGELGSEEFIYNNYPDDKTELEF